MSHNERTELFRRHEKALQSILNHKRPLGSRTEPSWRSADFMKRVCVCVCVWGTGGVMIEATDYGGTLLNLSWKGRTDRII